MEVISLILATYVISSSVVDSDGPWGIFYKFRETRAVNEFGILECLGCTALYVSGGLVLAFNHELGILGWLGVWGASSVLDRVILGIMK